MILPRSENHFRRLGYAKLAQHGVDYFNIASEKHITKKPLKMSKDGCENGVRSRKCRK